ncbi:hypothetical protein FH972_021178 [Carpinus fangiana]|uniref:ERCC4 domain-containing protein n=1 Tax=Carpinus fangiana TaxID=176857 RepID=A0A5N6KP69_9ROSI|nr:hypothetical protein FH972_021178 [Carpinus fangiana]
MPAEERPPVKLSLPLQDLFKEICDEDSLVVLARGLGLLRVIANVLHAYDAARNNLVLVVGADERENEWLGESLAERAAVSMAPKAKGLRLVTTDLMTVGTREQMYSTGGLFSITSRILVVDFLSGLLDPAKVTGIVVLHADRVSTTSIEAFILRIYRQRNKTGFLKAFSDNPESLASGYDPLARILRNTFLRKPSLWPRFHVTVAKSLEGRKRAEVIELEIPMSDFMKDIQVAVLDCIDKSISELKKANTSLEGMEDWNIDSALHRNFDSIIRRQLDPNWHRLSARTKRIVNDLSTLRVILHFLLTNDAVSFHKYLETVHAASSPPPGSTRQNESPWLFLDSAHTLFDTAKRRVYEGKFSDADKLNRNGIPTGLQPVLEEQPKWSVLSDILNEIERDIYFHPVDDSSNGSILVMAGDQNSCRQIREYLQTMNVSPDDTNAVNNGEGKDSGPSASFMMRRKLRNYIAWKKDFNQVSKSLFSENEKLINDSSSGGTGGSAQAALNKGRGPPNKRRRVRGGGQAGHSHTGGDGSYHISHDRDAHIASLLADLQPTENETLQKGEIAVDPLDDMEDHYELYDMKDLLLIHAYDGDKDELLLEEVKPRYMIMYEPDAAFIRRVETYRSSHTDRNVRVYFLYYGGSVEEQRYLSAVRREKDAFTKLIRERSTMTVTLTTDAHGLDDPQEAFLRTVNTRIAGGGRLAATAAPPRVVVDIREFRSSLPSLCHGRAMLVVPCTLTVGDYVLSPDMCVERKSVKDLISSFKDGRLYTQAATMLQHYRSPLLLIEFDENKSFTLAPFADLTLAGGSSLASLNPAASSDLQSKLVLLTLAFPRLRIIWSSSPYQTAQIFEELKKGADEPDPLRAVQIGLQAGEEAEQQTFSQAPQDMLRVVPGVTPSNHGVVTLEVESIQTLANMEPEMLEGMIGREAGRQIGRFFARSVFDDE